MIHDMLATVSVAALLFAWGGVVYGVLFKHYFARTLGGVFRPQADINVPMIFVEKLVQAALLVVLYHHFDLGGAAFGALTGALLQTTYFFSTWINYRVPVAPVALITIVEFPRAVVAGIVIGAIAG